MSNTISHTSHKINPYGLDSIDLIRFEPEHLFLRSKVVKALAAFRKRGKELGFDLRVESAYRSFDRQVSIWNRKAKRELPLLDAKGHLISKDIKNPEELVKTLLLWSALPGASRHHFGTEIDIVDASAIPHGYAVKFTPEESHKMFKPFHDWITEEAESFGFLRVFIPGRGSIQPEPWHLSYIEEARLFQELFDLKELEAIYMDSDIAGKSVLLENLEALAKDYIYPYFL